MIGIKAIAKYVPECKVSNLDLMDQFGIGTRFLIEKIGVLQRSIKTAEEDTSDMALKALENLLEQTGLQRETIEVLVVVTQNPDTNLPHASGLVHGKANLSPDCAAFDISLGCSGYVYALSIIQSFMLMNGMTIGVLITCDPYSKVIDPNDKGTVLLFGDASTATLIGSNPILTCDSFLFGTKGDLQGALVCHGGVLSMEGREVFNFAVTTVPNHVNNLLNKAGLTKDDIDCYVFHQGSRFIVETLAKRLTIESTKVRVGIESTGNTVSSSIPLLLQGELSDSSIRKIVLCGFGVGLSWAGCVCNREV